MTFQKASIHGHVVVSAFVYHHSIHLFHLLLFIFCSTRRLLFANSKFYFLFLLLWVLFVCGFLLVYCIVVCVFSWFFILCMCFFIILQNVSDTIINVMKESVAKEERSMHTFLRIVTLCHGIVPVTDEKTGQVCLHTLANSATHTHTHTNCNAMHATALWLVTAEKTGQARVRAHVRTHIHALPLQERHISHFQHACACT